MAIMVKARTELEQKFRKKAMEKFGFSKGAIKTAVEEAMENWVEGQAGMEKADFLPDTDIEELEGLLSHVKQTSTEAKHEASRIFAGLAAKKGKIYARA